MFKTKVNRKDFLEVLHSAQHCVSLRPIIPETGTFRLILDNDTLSVQSTDTKIAYASSIEPVSSTGSGSVCAPRQLADIVNLIADNEIELVAHKSEEKLSLSVKSPASTVKLNCMADTNFPVIPSAGTPLIDMSAYLAKMISGIVQPVAQKEGSNPLLASVHLRISGGKCDIMATDGYAFSILKTDSVLTTEDLEINIPIDSVSTLLAVAPCKVSLNELKTHIVFSNDSRMSSSAMMDVGQYPDLRKFIKTIVSCGFKTKPAELNRVILLSTATHKKDSNSVNVIIDNGTVSVTAESELSNAKSEVSATGVVGSATIRFSTQYLVKACKMFADKEITVNIETPDAMIMIDPGISNYIHGIMPMQVK